MATLLSLSDDLFANVLKYLQAADLRHLRLVCHKFYGKDPEKNAIQSEIKTRDEALILSKQFPPESPIMKIYNYRQRVVSFERCSEFAGEMTEEAQWHKKIDRYCNDDFCQHLKLHATIPELENGQRDGDIYLFFAQFTNKDKLLWEGFLGDYDPQSGSTYPMDDLLRKPDGTLNVITDVLGDLGNKWLDFQRNYVEESDVELHLDTGNITNVSKEVVGPDLYVTLVALIQSVENPSFPPDIKVLYHSQGLHGEYSQLSSPDQDSLSVDVLRSQYVQRAVGREAEEYGIPFLIWKSRLCLHSFSLIFKNDGYFGRGYPSEPEDDDNGYDDDDSFGPVRSRDDVYDASYANEYADWWDNHKRRRYN